MKPDGYDYLVSTFERTDNFVPLDTASDGDVACLFKVGADHSEEVTLGTDAGQKQTPHYSHFQIQRIIRQSPK